MWRKEQRFVTIHGGLGDTQLLNGGDRIDPLCENRVQGSHTIYRGHEFDVLGSNTYINGPSYERKQSTQDGLDESNKRTPIAGQKASRMDLSIAPLGDCFSTQYVVYS